MTSIANNIKDITNSLPSGVKLVAVSKTKPNEDILEAYSIGQRIFGENKVQDLSKKSEELPSDIEWHFIGHLQTNKVKYLAPFVSLIHAVDSLKLLKTIHKEAAKNNRVIDCLLQCKVATEESKFGMSESELFDLLSSESYAGLSNIRITGLMGMATNTANEQQVRKEFGLLKKIFEKVKAEYFTEDAEFKELSMGMSHDYTIAVEEGSTMVRVGSSIFGERNYTK